jgi:hypothetical protein
MKFTLQEEREEVDLTKQFDWRRVKEEEMKRK